MSLFKKAQRSLVYLKIALSGVTGSGKTYSALLLAQGLVAKTGKRIVVEDTENGSASLYADRFDFDVMNIPPPFESMDFVEGIREAVAQNYGVVIIDSASHFWKGILKYKDQIDSRGKGNSYTNWGEADKKFDPVIEEVLQSKIHIIFCMRSKMDYVQEEVGGKKTVRKVGLAPIMRDGIEYEFTTVFDLANDNTAAASKDRSGMFPPDRIFKITKDTGIQFADWLESATPIEAKPETKSLEPGKPKKESKAAISEPERRKKAMTMFSELLAKNQLQSSDRLNLFWDTAANHIASETANPEQMTVPQLGEIWEARTVILEEVETALNSIPTT